MTQELNSSLHKLISNENEFLWIFFKTIKRSLNSGKKAENGFISDLFMRRTMAALTSTFIFPSSSFFFSRLLCRLLSGAALHFFLWKRFFWSAEAASFFIRKDGATFSNARPAFPVGSPEPVTFWFIAIFLLFLQNSRFNWIEMFQNQMLEIYVIKVNFRIWLFNWIRKKF